jgi:site-specific recombinase XerD
MRRWDSLLEKHVAGLATRGLSPSTITTRRQESVRFGAWWKARRPKLDLERVDAELVVRYLASRTAFRSRSTVSGVVSNLRCIGEFLVGEGVWRANPLRWMRGPKMDARRVLPRRVGRAQLQALWEAAQRRRQEHARYQALCALSILYATGLRRGEVERLGQRQRRADR